MDCTGNRGALRAVAGKHVGAPSLDRILTVQLGLELIGQVVRLRAEGEVVDVGDVEAVLFGDDSLLVDDKVRALLVRGADVGHDASKGGDFGFVLISADVLGEGW